jgi:hypothetical protein
MIGSTGIHRMTAVLTLRLPLSTYFGNANSSTRDSRAPKLVTSARVDFVVIETHLSLGF